MSAAHPTPSSNNDQRTMMLMALALILIAIVIFHSIFYYACCAMLYYLWTLADFASIHTYVAVYRSKLIPRYLSPRRRFSQYSTECVAD